MTNKSTLRVALAAVLIYGLNAEVYALPPTPPGWDHKKWNDPDVQNPKYVVGRIVAAYPHTPSGLVAALPQINMIYEGTTILNNKVGDTAIIPCVGHIDLIQNAVLKEDTGTAWQWLVAKDLCGTCTPRLCTPMPPETEGTVKVNSFLDVVKKSAADHPDLWRQVVATRQQTAAGYVAPRPSGDCREAHQHALVALHAADPKWGYDCRTPDCEERVAGIAAYYSGSGDPNEGSPSRVRYRIISGRCNERAQPVWEKQIDNKPGYWSAIGLTRTVKATGCRWVTERACMKENGAEVYIESRNGNGHADCKNGPGPGFSEYGSAWVRMISNTCPSSGPEPEPQR